MRCRITKSRCNSLLRNGLFLCHCSRTTLTLLRRVPADIVFFLLLATAIVPVLGQEAPKATTEDGTLQGVLEGDVISFKGIPYAAPPIGELRWRPPQPVASWTGVRLASQFSADCVQKPLGSPASLIKSEYSEDCLYLNVWRPAQTSLDSKLPVMVWIHGGGFVNGGSSDLITDGSSLASQGIIVVTFNYRLGRFGFFAHPALSAEQKDSPVGNYGYMDQTAALKWVRRNISAFGGDSNNVTIIGESAGGQSTLDHLTMADSRGLFQRAIVMSGGGRTLLGGFPITGGSRRWPDAEEIGLTFAQSKGIRGTDAGALAKLRALPSEEILGDNNMVELFLTAVLPRGPLQFARGPILDGELLAGAQDQRFEQGSFTSVPLMIGTTSRDIGTWYPLSKRRFFKSFGEEARLAHELFDPTGKGKLLVVVGSAAADRTMHEPARFIARKVAGSGQPVWRYRFSYVADSARAESWGAEHSSELPYMFGTLKARYGDSVTAHDRALSTQFQAYIVNFVKTGDPNGSGLTSWPAEESTTDAIMDFASDGKSSWMEDSLKVRLDLMERVAAAQPRPIGIAQLEKPDWSGFIAAGALSVPTYVGSSQYQVTPVPVAELTFRDRVFASVATTGRALAFGWHTYNSQTWRISGIVGLADKREESDADALAGMGDHELGLNSGVVIVRRSGLLSQTLNVTHGINDGAGLSASLGAGLLLPFSLSTAVTAGASLKYADSKQMRYDFGVNQEQATRRSVLLASGDPRLRSGDDQTYSPDGGLQSAGFNLAYLRLLKERWLFVLLSSYTLLLDNAADSPLVEEKGSFMLGLGFGWKF